MFIPSEVVSPIGLSYIGGCIRACARVLINTFPVMWVWLRFVAAAKDIFEFRCRGEGGGDVGLFEDAAKLGANLRYIRNAHVRIFLISLAEVDILERQVAEQVAYFPFVVGCWALVFVVVFRAIFVVVLVLIDGPRDVCVSDVLESLAVMAVILIHFYDELYGLFCFFGSGAQAVASAHFTFE